MSDADEESLVSGAFYNLHEQVEELLQSKTFGTDALSRALRRAAGWADVSINRLLLEAGGDPSRLVASERKRKWQIPDSTALAEIFVNVEVEESDDARALQLLRMFLDAGADPNVRDEALKGSTALIKAVDKLQVAAVALLLERGADPNIAAGDEQNTALLETYSRGDDIERISKITRMLLEKGAGVDVRDYEGRTPLMLAAECGAVEAVQELVRAGADINAVNENAKSAFELAAQRGHIGVTEYLLGAGAQANEEQRLRAKITDAHKRKDWEAVKASGVEALAGAGGNPTFFLAHLIAAHQALREYDQAADCAERALNIEFSDGVLADLIASLVRLGRREEAVGYWQAHEARLDPADVEPMLVANAAIAYAGVYGNKAALEVFEPWILANEVTRHAGLLHFNASCFYALTDRLEEALGMMERALSEGHPVGGFETDEDLRALRAHPAYAWVREGADRRVVVQHAFQEFVSATVLDRPNDVRELVLDNREVFELCYADGRVSQAHESEHDEFQTLSQAALAYLQRMDTLKQTGWHEVESPALAYWRQEFESALARLVERQKGGELPALTALVLEWDYGDTSGERNYWFGAYAEEEDAAQAGEKYASYVYGDGVLAEINDYGPPVYTGELFRAIVDQVKKGDALAALEVSSPFYFVFQEHDAGHICTVAL